jgi:hypothetical protein
LKNKSYLIIIGLSLLGAIVNNMRLEKSERLNWLGSAEVLAKPPELK